MAKGATSLSTVPHFPRPNLLPRAQPRPRPQLQLLRPKSTVSLPFRLEGAGTRGQCWGSQLLRAWTGLGVQGWGRWATVVT